MLVYRANEETINDLVEAYSSSYNPSLSVIVFADGILKLEVDNTLKLLEVSERNCSEFKEFFDELAELLTRFYHVDFSEVKLSEKSLARFLSMEKEIT